MKKLLVLASLLSIVISLSLSFSCEKGYFCCEERHSSSSQCSVCGTTPETAYDIKSIPHLFFFKPTFLRQIFFQLIHTEEMNFIPAVDRPPMALA
ncbi:hypothetical protein DOM21_02385 [Bacteriovorax stolpii]|uniref:hypothetical protein n=1 Tax=Bacteriovorax stolpii TaxID=960 RepID=UPI00105C0933|nr:hypothetical protein [Bacteriovorax stolpii]QDK40319.1 hypothetical protein DOM21_02385 [Bacteriovorax stolpii]